MLSIKNPLPRRFSSSFSQIQLIAFDVYRQALREKMMYGFLLLSFLFILLSNIPYMVNDRAVFENQPPLTSALQVAFMAVNIFTLLIAIFVSVNTLQNYLALDRLELLLVRPVSRWKIFSGVILGLYQMILVNWALLTAGIWLVVVSHEQTVGLFVWKGFSIVALLGMLYISLVVFFYSMLPNALSGVMAVFIVIAGFGANSAAGAFSKMDLPYFLPHIARFSLHLLPPVNALLALSMKTLLIFPIEIEPGRYLLQLFFIILILDIVSCNIFARRSQI